MTTTLTQPHADPTHDCADDYCVGRDSQGGLRMNGGNGRLVANADHTVDNVREWFERSKPGQYREDYRAVLRFLRREQGMGDDRPVHRDEENGVVHDDDHGVCAAAADKLERLTAPADLLSSRPGIIPGPWRADGYDVKTRDACLVAGAGLWPGPAFCDSPEDASLIAAMGPQVAERLIPLLRDAASSLYPPVLVVALARTIIAEGE